MTTINKRYDFVYFFDVQDGNPNGDPDAGNLPRIDAETGMGLVTDVCLKRKIRNYVYLVRGQEEGFDIFVKEKAVLNRAIKAAWDEASADKGMKASGAKKNKAEDDARALMCRKFFDIRAFGAVLNTGEKGAGQVRGPIQLTFSRSVEPVVTLEHTITRMAVTNEKDELKERTMGRKFTIPYGLYRAHGFISAHLAQQTGFSEEDLNVFWDALIQMFEHDHSAARGFMSARKLVIFEHDSPLGNSPAYKLFERVSSKRVTDGPAREFNDYRITVDGSEADEPKIVINASR
jgi:CRISPR-associated protein Csd2